MKEIFAKILNLIKRFFCLFKLTISCKLGFTDKDEESERGTSDGKERNRNQIQKK